MILTLVWAYEKAAEPPSLPICKSAPADLPTGPTEMPSVDPRAIWLSEVNASTAGCVLRINFYNNNTHIK